jgi:AI-2 transport protein TqsA
MAEETRADAALGGPPEASPPTRKASPSPSAPKAFSGGPSGSAPKAFRSLVTVAAFVVIIAGLKLAGAVLVPFLMAVFLSALATPIVLWLEQRGLPPGWSVLVTMVAVLGAMIGVGALVTGSIAGFDQALPGYRAALDVAFHELVGHLAGYGIDVEQAMSDQALEPGIVLGMAGSFVGNVLAALSNTTLVLLTMVFFLLEVAGFPAKLRAALGDPQADLSEFTEIMAEVQRYLVIKTAVSAVTGGCVALLLTAVGVDFAVLWGLVAFLLNFIPNIGSIIAAVPAIAIALVQPGLGVLSILVVGLGYLVINMVIGNIIEPQLTGRRLGLSPLVVFLSLVFWGWVWGTVGMLLSVPLTIVVRIVLERNHELRWIAVLLGPSPEWERPRGTRLLGRLGLRRAGVAAAAAGQGSAPADADPDDERG